MASLQKRWLPLLLAAGAFLFRIIAGLQLLPVHPGILTPSIVTDMATYQKFAADILQGTFPKEFYYQPFYYSVFLPLVQFLTGPSAIAILIAQSLCGSAAVLLTWLCAIRMGAGRFGAGVAAFLLTFSAMSTVYTPFCLLETLQALLLVLILHLTLRAMQKKNAFTWGCTGLALGCAILTRGNALLLLPAILLGLFLSMRRLNRRRKLCACSSLIALMLLIQLPFAAVNTIARGSLRGPSTAGGNVLALGNTPEAPPGHLVYPRTYSIWMSSEADQPVINRMLNWMKEEPLAFFEHQFLKMLQFWNYREIGNNIDPERTIQLSPMLKAIHGGIPTAWILTAALAGVLLSLKRMFQGKYRLLTAVFYILLYCPAVAAFYNLARFRVPGIPILCAAAALFFYALAHARQRKKGENRRKSFIMILGAGVCGFAIVYPGFDWYMDQIQPALMRVARPHGVDVPNGHGGRLIYDHTLMVNGGWFPIKVDTLLKQFDPRTPIQPGTPVLLKIHLAGPAYFYLNGKLMDLRNLREGNIAVVKIPSVYPEDGIFRFESGGNAIFLADRHRNYHRTRTGDLQPINAELVLEMETKNVH